MNNHKRDLSKNTTCEDCGCYKGRSRYNGMNICYGCYSSRKASRMNRDRVKGGFKKC